MITINFVTAITAVLSSLSTGSILLFFIKRYFSQKDKEEELRKEREKNFFEEWERCQETIRLSAYNSLSSYLDSLLDKGYSTTAERRFLDEMYANYKAHKWNGDMKSRLEKVYVLPIKDS